MRSFLRCVPLLLAGLALGAAEYAPPATWDSIAGNPTTGGPGVWTAYQLFPADPMVAANYHVLERWSPELKRYLATANNQGNDPYVAAQGGRLEIGIAGKWNGGAEFEKIAAVGFTAPATGTYVLRGRGTAAVWTGDAVRQVLVLTLAAGKAKAIKAMPLVRKDGAYAPLEFAIEVPLAVGDQVVLLLRDITDNTGAVLTLDGLTLTGP